MRKKIEELEKKLVESTCAYLDETPWKDVDTCELGQITDMIKDLAEARFREATTKAMEEQGEYDDEKMGYDNYRYMRTGRFAPTGRGTYRPGYTPMVMDEPRDFPGYSDNRYNGSSYPERGTGATTGGNGRMGYPMDTTNVGRSYAEYRDRRRSYTENQTADNRRMMEDSAQRHLDETIETIKEIWADVDQPERIKMKEKVSRLVQDMA